MNKKEQEKKHLVEHEKRKQLDYHDGFEDGFEPLKALDLNEIDSFDELTEGMKHTAFGGRQLGEAVDVLHDMVLDPETFVIGTFSGAMTPAKMGLLICEMIDRGMLQAIVTTGALMTHGMVESFGMNHFKYKPGQMDDKKLYDYGYDRIYDVLELEKNLDDLELLLDKVLSKIKPGSTTSSQELNYKIGEYLSKTTKKTDRAILKSAYEKNVPVYIPAFTDSEFGLDFALYNRKLKGRGKKEIQFNPIIDLEHVTRLFAQAKKTGIFTIGGGVPRNWAQQVPPYLDLIEYRLETQGDLENKGKDANSRDNFSGATFSKRFHYAVRICPEPAYWGGLSGATYSEGVSWGKFIPPKEGGKLAEVYSDATIAWPLILKATMQKLDEGFITSKVKIKKSKIGGKGLFATEKIFIGEVITDDRFSQMDFINTKEADKMYDQGYDMLWQVDENKFYSGHKETKDYPAMYMNHSCDPTVGFDGTFRMIALRDIKISEEITFDYATSESSDYEMKCSCKSKICRKIITGGDWRDHNLQEKYKGHFIEYIQKKIDKLNKKNKKSKKTNTVKKLII